MANNLHWNSIKGQQKWAEFSPAQDKTPDNNITMDSSSLPAQMEWNYQVNKILTPKNPCNLSFFFAGAATKHYWGYKLRRWGVGQDTVFLALHHQVWVWGAPQAAHAGRTGQTEKRCSKSAESSWEEPPPLESTGDRKCQPFGSLTSSYIGPKGPIYKGILYFVFFVLLIVIFFSFQERLQYQFQLEAYGKICQYYAAPGDQWIIKKKLIRKNKYKWKCKWVYNNKNY